MAAVDAATALSPGTEGPRAGATGLAATGDQYTTINCGEITTSREMSLQ